MRVLDATSGRTRAQVRPGGRPEATALALDGAEVVVAGRRTPGAVVADARTGAVVTGDESTGFTDRTELSGTTEGNRLGDEKLFRQQLNGDASRAADAARSAATTG